MPERKLGDDTELAADLHKGRDGAVEMLGIARSVFSSIGLKLDDKKTNIFRRGRRQCCTGLVVKRHLSASSAWVSSNVSTSLRVNLSACPMRLQGSAPSLTRR